MTTHSQTTKTPVKASAVEPRKPTVKILRTPHTTIAPHLPPTRHQSHCSNGQAHYQRHHLLPSWNQFLTYSIKANINKCSLVPLTRMSAAVNSILNFSSSVSHLHQRMPAIPLLWMDTSRWQQESFDWATYAYQLLAPRVNVKGRMALLLLVAVIWAFGW